MNEIVYSEQIQEIPKDTPLVEIQEAEIELMKKVAERYKKSFTPHIYKNEYLENLNKAINGEIEVAVTPKSQKKKEVSILQELEQA